MKRLSVIIPGYKNRFEWWTRCVKSVLAATTSEDEILCVDDASPDQNELKAKVASGIWRDPRIRWIWRVTNGGLSAARNFAIEVAGGRYIAFVDSDDEVCPDVYARAVEYLENTRSDVVVFGVKTVWVEERLQKHDVPISESLGTLRPSDVKALLQKRLFNYAWNKVYSTDFVKRQDSGWNALYFDPNGMPCEDLIFNLNLVMAGARWCTVDYEGYVYYRTGGTLLSNYKPTNRDGICNAANAWKTYCEFNSEALPLFGSRCEVTEVQLQKSDWDNMWRPRSPYSLSARWNWLKCHPAVGGRIEFLKKMLYTILRRYCYFVALRRWHIKRLYPISKEWE